MRIIAGTYKGRKLLSPPGKGTTRPITGRLKKSLFGMLSGHLPGATVLDLYCGTGTLGLEAMSRGAERCFFAERDRTVIRRLQRNIEDFDLAEKCLIWRGDIVARLKGWLDELDGHVDIAFVDPPYAQSSKWSWETVGETIFTPLGRRLAEDGVVVLRLGPRTETPSRLGPLAVKRLRRYGDMVLVLLGRAEQDE